MRKSNFFSKKKKKKITKPKKEYKFLKPFFRVLLNIHIGLGYFIRTAYQFSSQSMGQPYKRKTARDSLFVG